MGKHTDRRTCQRKVKYDNQTNAVSAARNHDSPMRTYPCSICGGWHLATRGKGREKAQKIWAALGHNNF